MTAPRLIALFPMKARSQRVPGKNFRNFAGKPLFRWMLDVLLSMPEIDRVVINTDARALLAQHGVEDGERVLIRDRADELCGDAVSMNRVLADDVSAVEAKTYLMTHTTNPLLRAETIRAALSAYESGVAAGSCDSLFTVNRYQSRFYGIDGSPLNHDPANLVPTQDLPPWFEENSNMYLFSRESFAVTRARIGPRPMMFETPRLESADIDDVAGWDLAECLAESRALVTDAGGRRDRR